MNAVDVIYAAMPGFITLWPDLIGYLLTPLLEFQSSPEYTLPYAAQDVGTLFCIKPIPFAFVNGLLQEVHILMQPVTSARTILR